MFSAVVWTQALAVVTIILSVWSANFLERNLLQVLTCSIGGSWRSSGEAVRGLSQTLAASKKELHGS